jgi:lipopolysaccharide/colanic/teichoic acid biosynthesis glycosyltransferase
MSLNLLFDHEPYLTRRVKIDYVGNTFTNDILNEFTSTYEVNNCLSLQLLYSDLLQASLLDLPDVLLLEVDDTDDCFLFIKKIRQSPMLQGILIFLLSNTKCAERKRKAKELNVHDYYSCPVNFSDLSEQIKFMIKLRIINPTQHNPKPLHHEDLICHMPLSKRIFDILLASVALILLSPLFVLIAILICLESKGPVIYKSKRAGAGYKIFDFYKFRSMRNDADRQLSKLAELNQYSDCEKGSSAFIKIVNDPRVTRVGKFIRNTSIDELPQLFNILIGDMSFVGNRPLPLYEAEMLTSNEWAKRFLGPAGLTGLWQVSKRGKKTISERERKQLDNYYARQHSFMLDMKIILKTFPALVQSERV